MLVASSYPVSRRVLDDAHLLRLGGLDHVAVQGHRRHLPPARHRRWRQGAQAKPKRERRRAPDVPMFEHPGRPVRFHVPQRGLIRTRRPWSAWADQGRDDSPDQRRLLRRALTRDRLTTPERWPVAVEGSSRRRRRRRARSCGRPRPQGAPGVLAGCQASGRWPGNSPPWMASRSTRRRS